MEAASMLDDDSSSSNDLLEDISRNNGLGLVEDHDGSCTATATAAAGPQKKKTTSSSTAMNWKKITWDDISCTEEEVNIISKYEKTRLKTILGISPKKITAKILRTVCVVLSVDGWSRKNKYQMCELIAKKKGIVL
jgi:hypothetical protein